MPAQTRAWQSLADLRAERHAKTFTPKQAPRDPQVEALMAEGYNLRQIASMLNKPVIDVRLAMAVAAKGAA